MTFFLIMVIIVIGGILSHFYSNYIDKYQQEITNLNINPKLVQCVNNTYLQYYTDIHLDNLNYAINKKFELDKRFENMFVKFKKNNTKVYKKYYNTNGTVSKINGQNVDFLYDDPKILNFFSDLKSCNLNDYTLYFKDLTYFNNGVLDIPKLNINIYKNNSYLKYNKLLDAINNNKLELIGKVNIEKELNEKYDDLNNILNELTTRISQYSLLNDSSKDLNMFSVKNGVGTSIINDNNIPNTVSNKYLFDQDLYDFSTGNQQKKVFIKLNGGLSKFIQSNGFVFIDSYLKYCYGNNCSGNNGSTVHTSFTNPLINICSTINNTLDNSNLFFDKHLNGFKLNNNIYTLDNVSTKTQFQTDIATKHNFSLCINNDNKNKSSVLEYLKNITNINNDNDNYMKDLKDQDILEYIYSPLHYINKFFINGMADKYQVTYDIRQWTSSKEKKTFEYKNTENGITINVSENADFLKDNLNIDLSEYTNPFFPDNDFDFFINNSSVDLLYKELGQKLYTTRINKTKSFIQYAIPILPDIKTKDIPIIIANDFDYSLLEKYHFLLMKLIEGLIIY